MSRRASEEGVHALNNFIDSRASDETFAKSVGMSSSSYTSSRFCIIPEQVFTLRNIIEQSPEHQQDLIINFIDYKKAFDSVHRPSLWKTLKYYGIPDRFINILKALYINSSCSVKTASGYTQSSLRSSQGSTRLHPFTIPLHHSHWLHHAQNHGQAGVWHCLAETEPFNGLDFADDLEILAEEENLCQEMTTKLEEQNAQVELNISREKTKVRSWESLSVHQHSQ